MNEQTWTIKKILDWSVAYFYKKGIGNPRLNSEWLLGEVLQLDRIQLYLNFDKTLNRQELSAYRKVIEQRITRKPLQYILGHYEFMGLDFLLNEHVLIPRPETELLVEEAVISFKRKKSNINVLEVGVGSGCIPVSLIKFLPERIHYDGLEISSDAIKIADKNINKHNISDNIKIYQQDFLAGLPDEISGKKYDLIISNPPYVSDNEWDELEPEIKNFEPKSALVPANKNHLIFYEKLAGLKGLLTKNGFIMVELNYNYWEEILSLFNSDGFDVVIKKDYSQKERILRAALK